MSELSEKAAVRRLSDRFGFGLGGEDLVAAQTRGFNATVQRYLHPTGSDAGAAGSPAPELSFLPRPAKTNGERDRAALKSWRQALRAQTAELTSWWLDRMVVADHQTTERLTWFWHGHFATSVRKVKQAELMRIQNQTFRSHALGRFGPLAQAMIIDPALLVWLDGNDNTAKAPNENLSREFMELFTLGHGDYSEDDVREAARALTGYKINRSSGELVLRPRLHDDGSKSIFGHDGDYDGASFVTLVLSQPAAADLVISRLWFRLVSAIPPTAAAMARLGRAYGSQRSILAVLAAIAKEPAFHATSSSLVKQPVEWAVGLLRALAVRPRDLTEQQHRQLTATLRGMGQVPFSPPSVGGWPAGGAWLTTAAALSRVEAARLIAAAVTLPPEATRTSTRNRPEYLRRLLGVEKFSPRTVDAIAAVADRLPAAIAVAACSPEYTVSA
jgi:uncharacterized protein (DUF1800 family)